MTRDETIKLMAYLGAAYPEKNLSEATVRIYRESLADLPFAETYAAARRHVMTSKWFPSIAELRRAVVEANSSAPDPGEAWAEVRRALERHGVSQELPPWSHPLINRAVSALGYRSLYDGGMSAADRARFLDLYKSYLETYLRDQQSGALPLEGAKPALPAGGDDEGGEE